MTTESAFADRFIFAREFQRFHGRWTTDGDLAKELGFSGQSEITTYKKRAVAPGAQHVLIIARRTGVDPGWLAFGADSEAPEPQGYREWLAKQDAARLSLDLRQKQIKKRAKKRKAV